MKTIQNTKIKNLYEIAKSVAIPKEINEHICSGSADYDVILAWIKEHKV